MRKITLFTLSLICAMFMASCSDDANDSYDNATILVSEAALTYDKEGGEQTFTVTVNEKNNFVPQWMNPVDWAKMSIDGDVVTVTVKRNETANSRTAKILVFTQNGGLQSYVDITQSEGDMVFDGVPSDIEFTRLGGEKILSVKTNASDWQIVERGADWMNVEIDLYARVVNITVDQNSLKNERTTVVVIKSGTHTKQINILQKGSEELMFAYQDFGASLPEIIKFEEERGGVYLYTPPGDFTSEAHNVMTLSVLTPKIAMNFKFGFYSGAIVYNSIPDADYDAVEEFIAAYGELLVKNGYTQVAELEYTKPFPSLGADVVVTLYADAALFETITWQPEAMPTFNAFPYGYTTWGANEAEVTAYETSVGGVFNAKESNGTDYMSFNVKIGDPYALRTGYLFRESSYIGLKETFRRIKDIDKMFYIASSGKPCLTKEYTALLVKEGFTYYRYNGGLSAYYYLKPSPKGGQWYLATASRADVASNHGILNVFEVDFGSFSGMEALNIQKLQLESSNSNHPKRSNELFPSAIRDIFK